MYYWAFQFSSTVFQCCVVDQVFSGEYHHQSVGCFPCSYSVGQNVQALPRLENGSWNWMCHWHKAVLGLLKLKGDLKDIQISKMLRTWITFEEARHFWWLHSEDCSTQSNHLLNTFIALLQRKDTWHILVVFGYTSCFPVEVCWLLIVLF
jgi:hypothetical protein